MFPRFLPTLVGCLLVLGGLAPAAAQQEDADQNAAQPPSVTMVHYGPGSAGGSLFALYPDQAMEFGQGETAFTGLLKRETTAQRHGGVLIVAPSGQSPDQGIAGALRTQLPEAGWLTLSIAQPVEPVAEIPERVLEPGEAISNGESPEEAGADDSKQAEEKGGADESAPDMTIQVAQGAQAPGRSDNWQGLATDRLEMAVDALRDEGVDVTVLVGIGDGADLVLRHARANGATFPPDQFGMVWIDARLRSPFSSELGAELGEGYQVPILDLYDRGLDDNQRAETRAATARRTEFEAYTQSAMPLPRGGGARKQRRVPVRIRGWLANNMKAADAQ
ncbi:DUF3530 family protein [Salicola sp. Rm-C-2C1-2]|uniref:DUF3530 family protein n=1 Tax=Salicola sp. Rm-C-2C1-2 TaxID=3141321 RepID=UPI0032E411AC